jgi:hypothetical protein
VGDHSFEVGLSFGGMAEKLVVPFEALTGFFDPSVQFGLKFSPDEAAADNDEGEEAALPPPAAKKPSRAKKAKEEKAKDEKAGEDKTTGDKVKSDKAPAKPEAPAAEAAGEAASDEEKPVAGAEVVSLDAFRKKK